MTLDSTLTHDEQQTQRFHRFTQRAMATEFGIFIDHVDYGYAEQAAYAAFEELHRLESELSRYIESSDVSLINKSPVNHPIQVCMDTLQCLQQAEQFFAETKGAFDVTSGELIDHWKVYGGQNQTPAVSNPYQFGLILNANAMTVTRIQPAIVDLGGIGKGYALDSMKETLQEWGIDHAILHSGWSTVLAFDPPRDQAGWNLSLRHPETHKVIQTVSLSNQAISGSGIQKGSHIVVPETGGSVNQTLAVWVTANTATAADAYSTACMILSISDRNSIKNSPAIHSILEVPEICNQ